MAPFEDDEAIDKNYVAHLLVIDWLFGTFYMPPDRKAWPRRYGTVGIPLPKGIVRQFLYPFRPGAKTMRSGTGENSGAAPPDIWRMTSRQRIEQLDPALDEIVDTSQPIHDLADGFGGEHGPAEGPLWWKEGGYLLFSDIHNDRRMKFTPGKGVSLFKEPTNRANGLTRDLQGRLARLRARQPARHAAGTRRQHHRDREQLPGTAAQPAE